MDPGDRDVSGTRDLYFDNYILPDIATYRVDDDGSGAFYPGDEDYTYLSVGLYVNAWMPLPEPYKEENY